MEKADIKYAVQGSDTTMLNRIPTVRSTKRRPQVEAYTIAIGTTMVLRETTAGTQKLSYKISSSSFKW